MQTLWLTALRWDDIDRYTGRLVVKPQVQRIGGSLEVVPVKTQNGGLRLLPPGSPVQALRSTRTRQRQKTPHSGCQTAARLVIPRHDSNPLGADAITFGVVHAGRKIGLSLSSHLLHQRHANEATSLRI